MCIRGRTRRSRTLLGCTKGQGMVEFSLALPVLMLLLLSTLEMGHFLFTRINARHSVLEATRFAVTGRTMDDGEDGSLSRVASIQAAVLQWTTDSSVDVENITILPQDGGGPGDVVRVTVDLEYRFALPLIRGLFGRHGIYFSVSTAMRNEPRF